jgi:ribosome-associated protein
MRQEELKDRNFEHEFIYSASKSSGPGGQNVNKVNTKVELRFNVIKSSGFSSKEKETIFIKLKNKINKDGELIINSDSERTQLMNKELVIEKFYIMISKALTIPKYRRTTKPTLTSKLKRLEEKKNQGQRKKMRKDSGSSEE